MPESPNYLQYGESIYKKIPIEANGNCLFLAFAQGLNPYSDPTLNVVTSTSDLRKRVAEYKLKIETLQTKYPNIDEAQLEAVQEERNENIALDGKWGGYPEIFILTQIADPFQ